MALKVPNVKLNNGVEIPILGLGTYKALGEEVKSSVKDALDIGYRHFDTADLYRNLEPLGEVLRDAIAAKKVTRQELFITTKVWPTDYSEGRVVRSVERQLKQSGLDYFDMILLHWPMVFADSDTEGFPLGEDGKVKLGTRSLPEIYAELETVQDKGYARSIGLSNFNAAQVKLVLSSARIVPVMNQVEAHVYFAQFKLQDFCAERQIVLTAYCPLARGGQPGMPNLIEDETLKAIGAKYGKSAAQVALRYLMQRGIVIIPKSIRRERLEDNFNLLDFELSAEDLATVRGLNRDQRVVKLEYYHSQESPNYPFNDEF